MGFLQIIPSKLSGTIKVPSSKSIAHRAIICAYLSESVSEIKNICYSDDVTATINAVKIMGGQVTHKKNSLIVSNLSIPCNNNIMIDCNESGSTLRFLIPIVAAKKTTCCFKGRGNLFLRPLTPYLDCLAKAGVTCNLKPDSTLEISGRLQPGSFYIPGNISSQFISGLLFALPILDGNSEIIITSEIESTSYIDMTINILNKFGIYVLKTKSGFKINGNQRYKSTDLFIESDWSQASFFMVAGAIGSSVTLSNLNRSSLQGDSYILQILKEFGANISFLNDNVTVSAGPLHGINIDASQTPDLVPILSVIACLATGKTHIYGALRARFKESDRIKSMYTALKEIGGDITETHDGFIINGVSNFKGGITDPSNDHRIVMALSVASIRSKEPLYIKDFLSINKSYPAFFEDFKSIGGKLNVVNLRK